MIHFWLERNPNPKQLLKPVLGEICANFVRTPMEVYKTSFQIGMKPNVSLIPKTFLKLCLRDIPFAVTQFTLYEYLKQCFSIPTSAFFAGFASGFITTPLDVIKTRFIENEKFETRELFKGCFMRSLWL